MATRTKRSGQRAKHGRNAGDAFTGLAAIAALCALLAGVPMALIAVFGLPIPHGMPSVSLFTHQLQASAVLKACSVVVWLAWLQFVWCVIAEVSAAVRNTGMPSRVPLAGGIQPLVHRLVTAALLLSAAASLAPALAPVAASAAVRPAQPGVTASAATIPGQSFPAAALAAPATNGAVHPPEAVAAALSRQARAGMDGRGGGGAGAVQALDADHDGLAHGTEKIYVVQPPVGRFHESLWEIAENHLGDGRRYREIFELNSGRPQPDGSKLTIASLIRPGWILRMPHDASGPGIEVVRARPGHRAGEHHPGPRHQRPPHGQHTPAPARPPAAPPAKASSPAVPPARATAPATPRATAPAAPPARASAPATPRATTPAAPPARASAPATPRASAPATPKPAASPVRAPAHRRTSAPAPSHSASPAYPLELAAAGLLAAGVMAALERRRRKQARRRPYGRQVVPPRPDATWAELALRLGEDEAAAQMLDAGLRYLCHALASQGVTPPTVFAAHMGEENLDLWVTPASHDAPRPWYPVGDGDVWRLALADAARFDLDQLSAPAPYPGLVSVGTDATGRVLVDVEAAHGVIAIAGPGELVGDALAAMAAELATSLWSDGMHLTLVGGGGDLAVLAPDRVHLAATLAEALPSLEAHAANVADALAVSGGSVLAGRTQGAPEEWMPHYLISFLPPTDAERDRLLALTRSGYCPAAGYLVAGELPGAAWTWDITEDGKLSAPQLGLDLAAQLIPHEQQVAMADLFDSAAELVGAPMSVPMVEEIPDTHLSPDAVAPVEVTMLGPASVRAVGEIEPDRLPLATELVIYLATHPGGVHPNVLSAAIWPRGVTEEVRDWTLARVQDWLGSDGIGRQHLASDASGRLRLGSGVRVDWHVFLTLITQAEQAADRAREEASLDQALSLVTGPFLAGTDRGRYAWTVTDGLEYEVAARVADAAHRLCGLRLINGDPHGAMNAARAGLQLAPDDELLWRDLLTAGHATGEEDVLHEAAGEVWARASMDGSPPGMAPETEALLDELLPTWRWTLA